MGPNEGYITTDDGIRLFFQKLGAARKRSLCLTRFFCSMTSNISVTVARSSFTTVRNCGRSDRVSDSPKLKRGIHHDLDDLEAVRRHFKITPVDVIGHSYLGMMVILYAIKYPAQVNRVVQIGPVQPFLR